MSTVVRPVASLNLRFRVSASRLRLLHSYMSAFIAPAIVFFAISGSVQIYDLHEAHGSYRPSDLISSMARLHKNQVFAPEPARGFEPAGSGKSQKQPGPQDSARRPKIETQLLKFLFLIEALTLVLTTLVGVWIGVTHPKRARSFAICLAAGVLLPVALIVF